MDVAELPRPSSPSSSSSPCPPPLSPSPRKWSYDVFLSFRGDDTRRSFSTFLFDALEKENIRCFRDDDRNERGTRIERKLNDAIWNSQYGVILFSKNYADSKWCLNELVQILECHKRFKPQHMVLPIFYDVKAADVRNQTEEFGEGFKRCEAKHSDHPELIQEWKESLQEAGKISGLRLQGDAHGNELKLVKKIVKQISSQILPRRFLDSVVAIGLDSPISDVVSLLNIDSEDVRMIGILGIEGIGKTTLAKCICASIYDNFDGVCFLPVGNETIDIVALQKKLLRDILKLQRDLEIYDTDGFIREMKGRLNQKRVLLVLDNVYKKSHIDKLAGKRDWFGPGSRILVTSRDAILLKDLRVDDKYILNGLDQKASLELFSTIAFDKKDLKEGYEELSNNFLHYTGGLPLNIEKLASDLLGKPKEQWKHMLKQLERNPHLDLIFNPSEPKALPPIGGIGGGSYDDKFYSGIRQVTVFLAGSGSIESFIIYYDQNGCLIRSSRHGGSHEEKSFTVKLHYPDEYATSITGYIRNSQSPVFINSLKIHTNKRTYGPFGIEQGEHFAFPTFTDHEKIIGFFGKCGCSLDSIGAYFGPTSYTYPFKRMGPFGREAGNSWDDGTFTDVRKIELVSSCIIESIAIVYDKDGRSIGPRRHGHNNGGKIDIVALEYPYEYLISIWGYIGEDDKSRATLKSLTIKSNIKQYGPFGVEKGKFFSFPSTGGKIVGFFGSCHENVESIGAYFEPVSHNYEVKSLGPFGGEGGHPWDDGKYCDLRQIVITSGKVIDSIAVEYGDGNGGTKSFKHGGSGPHKSLIKLDSPEEYLTSISGYIGELGRLTVVQSLIFQSNRRIYGPFGTNEGTLSRYFSLPSNIGKITGFHGRSGAFLDSIGAHFQSHTKEQMFSFRSVGLFGEARCGDSWDDGRFTDVRKINIGLENGNGLITSISFVYEEKGNLVKSEVHGINIEGNHSLKSIQLAFEATEYLTSFWGYTKDDSSSRAIHSLTFQSNVKTYGPFGNQKGKYFSSPLTGGKIVGFYGRSSPSGLNAIGAHYALISDLYPLKSIGPFGGPGGGKWDDRDSTGVKAINLLCSGEGIISLSFECDKNGDSFWTGTYGGRGQGRKYQIKLDYPHEYLTSISGYIREHPYPIIKSLTFQSNIRRYGPYGKEEGNFFSYPSTNTKIVGVHGRSGVFVDAIGVYAEPIPYLYPFKSLGPFGGKGGHQWDDGIHSDVREIHICLASLVVESISVVYDDNGSPVECSPHGRTDRGPMLPVKLDFPKEYLISISGYIRDKKDVPVVIQSLKIHTNKNTYGPYGDEEGIPFSFPSKGRIVGFFGRCGAHLDAIGAHLEPY